MFEDKIIKAFDDISKGGKLRNEFYILTHKKHGREIYFLKGDKDAIKFMKFKFESPYKKLVYFLIKFNMLQPFLKKIKLDSNVGSVVFVGGQIKIFNLEKKSVYSIPLSGTNKSFLKDKMFQKEIGKKGFAPVLFKINKNIPYSKEELLSPVSGANPNNIFKKLLEYYNYSGIKKISSDKYIRGLKDKLRKDKGKNDFFIRILNLANKKDIFLLTTEIHGDFAEEQVLNKNRTFVFTDWGTRSGLLTEDIIGFFRAEENLLGNGTFLELLELYPSSVKNNIKLYLILNEISLVLRYPYRYDLAKKRILNLLPPEN